jgi:Arc/MetJ-type ribon-helix-helix transcriptional regulator
MTKPRLTELAKARIDSTTKQQLEQLTLAFDYQDEADTIRAALREFLENHAHALPARDIISPRKQSIRRQKSILHDTRSVAELA